MVCAHPEPLQVPHLSGKAPPVPLQRAHLTGGFVATITEPLPLQVPHLSGKAPPVPLQRAHFAAVAILRLLNQLIKLHDAKSQNLCFSVAYRIYNTLFIKILQPTHLPVVYPFRWKYF
jgi:hypothetical protein